MGGGARGAGVLLWVLLATELVLQPQCGMAMAGARGGPGAAAAARQLLQVSTLLPCVTGLDAQELPGFLLTLEEVLSDVGIQYGTCLAPPPVGTAVTLPGDPASCCDKAKADFVKAFHTECYNTLCQIYKTPSLKPTFDGALPGLIKCFASACP